MAVILNLGDKPSCTIIRQNKNGIYEVVDYADFDTNLVFRNTFGRFKTPYGIDSKDVASALTSFFSEKDLASEKFYITLGGWDTLYHSDNFGEDEIGEVDVQKMTRDDFWTLVKSKVSGGACEGADNYRYCLISWANYAEKVVTFSMISEEYIKLLCDGFAQSPYTLFGICPLCYGIYNALSFDRHEFCIFDAGDVRALCNSFGIVIWPHSEGVQVSNSEEDDFLFYEFQRVYGMGLPRDSCMELQTGNFREFMSQLADSSIRNLNQLGALGMILPHVEEKALTQEEKKDFVKDVTDSIRKLLGKE